MPSTFLGITFRCGAWDAPRSEADTELAYELQIARAQRDRHQAQRASLTNALAQVREKDSQAWAEAARKARAAGRKEMADFFSEMAERALQAYNY